MALIRWNPASELMNLHSEMDRLFADLGQGFGVGRRTTDNGGAPTGFLPVDIERTDNAVVVHAPVPGYTPEEVSVTVDSGILTIEAQHRQEEQRTGRNWIRQERFIGRLHRQIALGEGVNEGEARASFQNGILTVTLPLTQRPEPKRIPVVVEAPRLETAGSPG